MKMLSHMMLKVVLILSTILLLVQVPRIYASGLFQYQSTCGTYKIRYSDDSDEKTFCVKGRSVDKHVFCKSLKFYYTKHRFIKGYVGYHYCGLDIPSDKTPLKLGRILLQKDGSEGSRGHDLNQGTKRVKEISVRNNRLTTKKLSIAAPVMFVFCCALLCPCFYARKKETAHTVLKKQPSSTDSVSTLEMNFSREKLPGSPQRVPRSPYRVPPSPSRFSMSPNLDRNRSVDLNLTQIVRATQSFSPSLIIGEGGFGSVYKAQLPDGKVVAVKRAKKDQFQAIRTAFRSEVELLSKIDHRNLVKLIGYVDQGNERLIITEYVPNGTLREHLDGSRGRILDFKQRLEICIDVAHGLTYLHLYSEKQIIHRDVKSSNILLTENMRVKVADFGFARLGDSDVDKTHVSTKVKGTIGYLDPEYMRTNQLTPKSDVYSFGVLLIEILTGRRPVEPKKPSNERVTLRWVFRKYDEGTITGVVDPLMDEVIDKRILKKMFGLAIQCAAPTRADRPDMKSVGEQLWGIRMDYVQSATSA